MHGVSEPGGSVLEKKYIHISTVMLHLELWHHLRMAAPVLLATTQSAPPTVHHVGTLLRKTI